MVKLINKETVSHITAFKETEGVWSRWGYWMKLLFVPYRKHTFWEFDKETKEGFYKDGCSHFLGAFRTKEAIEKSTEYFIRDSSVWTFPFIQIFCGEALIHTQHFRTYKELEKHLEDNYNNCNIRYKI